MVGGSLTHTVRRVRRDDFDAFLVDLAPARTEPGGAAVGMIRQIFPIWPRRRPVSAEPQRPRGMALTRARRGECTASRAHRLSTGFTSTITRFSWRPRSRVQAANNPPQPHSHTTRVSVTLSRPRALCRTRVWEDVGFGPEMGLPDAGRGWGGVRYGATPSR